MPVAVEAPKQTTSSQGLQPIIESDGERVAIYGSGGVGKSSLAINAPGTQGWIDLDRSLGKLKRLGTDMSRVKGQVTPQTFEELYNALNNFELWEGIDWLIIDSFTVVEELAERDVLKKHITSKGKAATSIVDYGFGDGFRLLYDRDDRILQALDNHVRRGRNVCVVCHEGTKKFKNAMGDDYVKLAPDVLQTSQYSFADRLLSWADHLLYIGYDAAITKGKAEGSGTRTIYTAGRPMLLAKSRTISEPELVYERGSTEVWDKMFGISSEAARPEPNTIKHGDNK